ncbi:uncharacterized protein A4U43_C08F12130 [Asparagus officinalis]|uniref:uncharacterized protein LOC109820665 n=1 Tax=Asparagus officinalis TaxID=4686 RepID=UPI00098DF87B|nr:uncharacterized protein LOC109820665 [Asparagus officinalis]ONK59902.1 uncharacterized protein A4U43_C08F12130 [Asparagus officinalis]
MSGHFYHVHGSEPGHCNYEIEQVSMLQSNKSVYSIEENLSFLPLCSQYRLVDCCHGLLLCDSFKGNPFTSYICNPATKGWTEFPMPDYHLILLALCFDPSISLHYTVLGFKVESSRDMIDENFINEIPTLFSSENPKWVEINVPWWCEMNSNIQQHVPLNGSIHFLGYTEPVVLATDLEREIYRKIELAGSKQEVVCWNACLRHSQGYLH